jgi:hypothetical protein
MVEVNSAETELLRWITDGISQAHDRIEIIIGRLRRFAEDLEAGKARSPKELRKLAGSLDYWHTQLRAGVGLCQVDPVWFAVVKSLSERVKPQEGQGGEA